MKYALLDSRFRKACQVVLASGMLWWAGPSQASVYLNQFDDLGDNLIIKIYRDGAIVQNVTLTGESYTGGYYLFYGVLSQDVNFSTNIYDSDGVTLSDTWHIFGSAGSQFFSIPFLSDVEGGPALQPLSGAQSIIENGDWQTAATFSVSNGDTYIWQFRSDVEATTVPEPTTLTLFLLGLGGLCFARKHRIVM
jgi:hypothetical protein